MSFGQNQRPNKPLKHDAQDCARVLAAAFGPMTRKLQLIGCALAFAALLTGCGDVTSSSDSRLTIHYANPSDQKRLKEALRRAKIPFEVNNGAGGREELSYESRFQEQVTGVRNETFGVAPPMGRSIALGAEHNALLTEELRKKNAPFWTVTYHEYEYIAWPPESDEAADAALQLISVNPDSFAAMKKMREAADAEMRDRTSRSNRSREERAPAER